MAIVALVLAICGIIPCIGVPLALAGLILGIIALAGRTVARKRAIAAVIVGGVLLVAVPLFVLLPAMNRAKELATRSVCMSSFKQIGVGIMMYCNANNDAYPPDISDIDQSLAECFGEDALTIERLACPNGWEEPSRGYFYLAPASTRQELAEMGNPSEIILACDWAGNHGQRRNVLFADTHVVGMNEEQFDDALALPQNAAFAAALRAAEARRATQP